MLVKYHDDYTVEDLGICEEWVYDIEVKNNHNFFANSILIHNSAYLLYDLPFNKYEDIHQLVNYVQSIARELGEIYNNALEYYLCNFAGLNPEYNTMDFKSEVIAYKGFFNTKKFYSLAKCWDEGVFFEEKPKLKTTGGQIKKSDVTQITKKLLTEIYHILVTDINQNDIIKMYRMIFIGLKNKYKLQISEDIENMEFTSFSVPKKWGSTEKSIPPFVTGAKLYNAIIGDTFRPSDAFIVVKVIIDVEKLLDFYIQNNVNDDKFTLQRTEVQELKNKINVISIPPILSDEEKTKLLDVMKKLNIRLNLTEIIEYNIDLKIDPFEKLFDEETRLSA